jgi:hypothetical protein
VRSCAAQEVAAREPVMADGKKSICWTLTKNYLVKQGDMNYSNAIKKQIAHSFLDILRCNALRFDTLKVFADTFKKENQHETFYR